MAVRRVSDTLLTSVHCILLTVSSKSRITVNFGATFAGVLHFRGFIMESIQAQKPIHEWPVQAIMSMFVSGIDPHRSFSKFFRETRARLLHCVCQRIQRKETLLQTAYILACLEYAEVPQVVEPNNPTRHMLLFSKVFQCLSAQYLIQNPLRNRILRKELPQFIARARSSTDWDKADATINAVYDFLYPKGPEAVQKAADDKNKRRRGKNTRAKKGKGKAESAAEVAARRMEEASGTPAITVANVRITNAVRQNPLYHALVQPMPGVNYIDTTHFELEADTTAQVSRLGPGLAQIDDDDDDADDEAGFGDNEVANVTHALDALKMKDTVRNVVLEEGDEVSFEQAIQQCGPQGVSFGGDEDVEMEM